MSYGDACSMRNTLSYSANPDANIDNWQDIVSLCGQLMEATGNPDADSEYYGADYRAVIEDPANANKDDQPAGGFSWAWPIDVGNPNLKPEIADTWTFGFVLDSFVDNIPALMDWRVSLDYYTIEISDAIGLQTGDVVVQQCLDPTFNPTYDPNSPYCSGFNRSYDDGSLDTIERSYFNNGRFQTSGIDLQINWGMEAGPGHINVNTLINYLIEMKSSELASNPMIDYVGTFGPSGNGLNGNSFEWRALTTVTYAWNAYDFSIRWQHLDKLKQLTGASTPLPSYDMFDLLGNYRLKDNISFRFGIENLFNTAPKLYGRDYTVTNGVYGGSFSSQLHDVVGRRFYVGAKVYF